MDNGESNTPDDTHPPLTEAAAAVLPGANELVLTCTEPYAAPKDTTRRKQTAAALHASEELNRQIIASSPDCIKVTDLSGRLLYISEGGLQLLELDDASRLIGTNWSEFWLEPDRATAAAAIAQGATGRRGGFQAYRPTAKGTPKWWEVLVTPLHGRDGKPERLLVISRDITEHRRLDSLKRLEHDRLDEEVRQQTAQLTRANTLLAESLIDAEDLYQNAPCGYHSIDRNGEIVRINDTELAWLGYRREELAGKKRMPELLTPESAEAFRVNFPLLLKNGTLQGMEVDFIRKDGSIMSALVNVSAIRDSEGQFVMSRATVYDITARKQQQQVQLKLTRALRLLTACNGLLAHAKDEQKLLESICHLVVHTGGYLMAWVGFAEHDPGKTVRVVAQSGGAGEYLKDLRLTWEDSELGRGPAGTAIRLGATQINQDVLTNPRMQPWRAASVKAGYRSSIGVPLSGSIGTFGVLVIYATEPSAFVPDEMALLEELAGNIAYGIEAMRARAVKEAMEQELEQYRRNLESLVHERTAALIETKKEAERANSAKSRFLAAASHDLRQPLTALKLYTEVLKRKLGSEDGAMLVRMENCLASLGSLLSKLLDLSKLEAGVVAPQLEEFPLDDLLGKVLAAHGPAADAKDLTLRCGLFGLSVRTDAVLFQRIVSNMVDNAIRYTKDGGVLIGCRRRGSKRWLEIWDTGIGIPENRIGEAFEEFKQLGDSARTYGSGLGLTIALRTSQLLGLEMRVRSRPGHGSMFAIELPVGQSAAPALPAHYSQPLRLLRIALVDDNPQVLYALTTAMESVGHQVIGAPSGAELLARLGCHPPDLMICDYRLASGETGFDVITSVRQHYGNRELPAIIITGDTDPNLMRSMNEQGIAIQHKPIEFEELQSNIDAAVGAN